MVHNFFPSKTTASDRIDRIDKTIRSVRDFEFEYFDSDNSELGYAYQGYYYDGRFKKSISHIIQYYNLSPESSVLDYGCAKGYLLVELYKLGIKNVTGYDISRYAIATAHKLVRDNVSTVPPVFKEKYDLIICKEVLPYLSEEQILELLQMFEVNSNNCYVYTYSVDDPSSVALLRKAEQVLVTIKSTKWWQQLFEKANFSGDYYIESII